MAFMSRFAFGEGSNGHAKKCLDAMSKSLTKCNDDSNLKSEANQVCGEVTQSEWNSACEDFKDELHEMKAVASKCDVIFYLVPNCPLKLPFVLREDEEIDIF